MFVRLSFGNRLYPRYFCGQALDHGHVPRDAESRHLLTIGNDFWFLPLCRAMLFYRWGYGHMEAVQFLSLQSLFPYAGADFYSLPMGHRAHTVQPVLRTAVPYQHIRARGGLVTSLELGLETWKSHFVVESLPIILQCALALLGFALSWCLWEDNSSVSFVVVRFTYFGFLFYSPTVAASKQRGSGGTSFLPSSKPGKGPPGECRVGGRTSVTRQVCRTRV